MFNSLKARATDLKKSVSANGILETVKLICSTLSDVNFDKEIGFSTQEPKLVPGEIEFSNQKLEGSLYLPARGRPFVKFLERQNFPKSYTFVDIGCGRGRVLWLAKTFGFAKVTGIEIDEELALAAKRNLIAKGLIEGTDFDIHAMNAADFIATDEKNIFFFYGPYISDKHLEAALTNLTRKKRENGDEQYMIYHCNICENSPLDRNKEFQKIADERVMGNRYFIYRAV